MSLSVVYGIPTYTIKKNRKKNNIYIYIYIYTHTHTYIAVDCQTYLSCMMYYSRRYNEEEKNVFLDAALIRGGIPEYLVLAKHKADFRSRLYHYTTKCSRKSACPMHLTYCPVKIKQNCP
jgi:hypothetical protein